MGNTDKTDNVRIRSLCRRRSSLQARFGGVQCLFEFYVVNRRHVASKWLVLPRGENSTAHADEALELLSTDGLAILTDGGSEGAVRRR